TAKTPRRQGAGLKIEGRRSTILRSFLASWRLGGSILPRGAGAIVVERRRHVGLLRVALRDRQSQQERRLPGEVDREPGDRREAGALLEPEAAQAHRQRDG